MIKLGAGRVLILAAGLALAPIAASAQRTSSGGAAMPADLKQLVLAAPATLAVSGKVSDIPAAVLQAMHWTSSTTRTASSNLSAVSDFGGPFNPSDVIGADSPPSERLLWAVRLGNYEVLAWQQGGFGLYTKGRAFRLDNAGQVAATIELAPDMRLGGSSSTPQANWAAFKTSIAKPVLSGS